MRVLFINSKVENCGVYQYGLRVWNIIKKSSFDISYHEVSTKSEFFEINFSSVDLVFFNWIEGGANGPFSWFDFYCYRLLKAQKIQVASVKHTDLCYSTQFDFLIPQDPEIGLLRPLYPFSGLKKNNEVFTIGSFGFAFEHKNFPYIVRLVNSQFDRALIKFNITNAFYGDADGSMLKKIINDVLAVPRKPGIEVIINQSFLGNDELLEWINSNDLIVFAYTQPPDISSVVDYVISTNTPLAVTNITAFRHIYTPYIDIQKYSLIDIYKFNVNHNYPKRFLDEWAYNNFLQKFESLISSYMLERTSASDKKNNFIARGNLGDLIHQLWVIKTMYQITGKKGRLLLTDKDSGPFTGYFMKDLKDVSEELKPILLKQEWLSECDVLNAEYTDVIDLSDWRNTNYVHNKSWTDLLSLTYNLPIAEKESSWLNIEFKDASYSDLIIIHESVNQERKTDKFPWEEIIKNNKCLFVYFDDSTLENFKFNHLVRHHKMKDVEECCIILNSCKFYVGNLTSVTAMAHAIGVPRLVELNSENLDHKHYIGEKKYFDNIWFLSDNNDFCYLDGVENHINLPVI